MSDGTHIEWTDATVNAVNGCSRVSPGCGGPGPFGGCYAERLAGTRLRNHPSRAGLTKQTPKGPRWTGKVLLHEPALLQRLRWRRPRRIFWNAHGDLFHESVPDDWIDRCFAVMSLTPHHIHQVLTKRAERMRAYFEGSEERCFQGDNWTTAWPRYRAFQKALLEVAFAANRADALGRIKKWPLPNVWLGVSVEDQARADERIPHLLATPAAVRWLSMEPLLGAVDLARISTLRWRGAEVLNALTGTLEGMFGDPCGTKLPALDWIVVGGESGPGARPMHPAWARSLRDQCAAAEVPFFFKQWGAWAPEHLSNHTSGVEAEYLNSQWRLSRVGKKAAGRLLDGVEHNGMPIVEAQHG